nr:phosphate signaling complex protein PhoU [Oceanococcus sp. HetDA_MAG_MS8]
MAFASHPDHYKRHISEQFNAELEDVRQRILAMGGLVEEMILDAVKALIHADVGLARHVLARDDQVNSMEVQLDEDCHRILARRQPAASDLRLVMACVKTINDLERMGDEAGRVAKMALDLAGGGHPPSAQHAVQALGRQVADMLHAVLDAFARMDSEAAVAVSARDDDVDREYEAILRQCITFMMEDPRSISRVLDIIWSVRSLERIGDHSKNIAEYIVYFVHGKDVRHVSLQEMADEVAEPDAATEANPAAKPEEHS